MTHMQFIADGALTLKAATPDKLPSMFAGLAYSGAVIARLALVIDLESTEVPGTMVLLHEHDRTAIVGVVQSATKRAGGLEVAGRLFSDIAGSTAERLAQLAMRGAPLQMSIGLFNFAEEFVPAGQVVTVGGKTVPGPVTVLRRGVIRECSIVTLGADSATSARLFSSAGTHPAKGTLLTPQEYRAIRARQAAGLPR